MTIINKYLALLLFTLTSCSTIKTIELDSGEEKDPRIQKIVFESYFNNRVRIYVDDSLIYNDRMKTNNPKVLTLTETVPLGEFASDSEIELKIGIISKKKIRLDWHDYAYIKRNRWTGRLTCELSNFRRKYK